MTDIIKAKKEDSVAIYDFAQRVSKESEWADYTSYSLKDFEKIINNSEINEDVAYFIAKRGDEVVGHIFCYVDKIRSVMEISSFVIDNNNQGTGVADSLLTEAIDFGKNIAKAKFIILYVRENNTRAIAFYKRNGFIIKDPVTNAKPVSRRMVMYFVKGILPDPIPRRTFFTLMESFKVNIKPKLATEHIFNKW